jgi:hypothetical protein
MEDDAMAHLEVNAVAREQAGDVVLVVSVVDDDGLPRAELPAAAFVVHQLTSALEAAGVRRAVVAAAEGPAGVYRLRLAPLAGSPAPPGPAVLAVVVAAPTEGGWADDHGQTLAFSPSR